MIGQGTRLRGDRPAVQSHPGFFVEDGSLPERWAEQADRARGALARFVLRGPADRYELQRRPRTDTPSLQRLPVGSIVGRRIVRDLGESWPLEGAVDDPDVEVAAAVAIENYPAPSGEKAGFSSTVWGGKKGLIRTRSRSTPEGLAV